MNELSDSKLISKRVVIELKKHDTDVNLEESKIVPCNKSPNITSPDKIWSVASRTESPKGEIKLCINRKKKSLNIGLPVTAVASPAIRVSRRMANEVGISAEQLQQLMTCSPSPQKRKTNKIPIMKKGLNLNKIKNGEKENITDSTF